MSTLVMQIEYDGTPFHGWQRQPGEIKTIENELLTAFKKISYPISEKTLSCAGRTDKGVHAVGQVVAVPLENTNQRKASTWLAGLNHSLPHEIMVNDVTIVQKKFHNVP